MVGMRGVDEQGNLMGSKRAFDLQAVDALWPGPPFGRSKDDHGPTRSGGVFVFSRALLNRMDLLDGCFDGLGHETMHHFRLVALDEQRIPAATAKELIQFLVLDAREDCRVADL